MNNINDMFTKVELERTSDTIILKAKISPEYYTQILKAFFSYTKVVEDSLNGKKRYISDIGTFSYYQLGYGQITKFNGHITEIGENSEELTIVVAEENNNKLNEKDEETIANIYETAKSNAQIDIYFKTTLKRAEKFLNYMETSLFDEKQIDILEEKYEKPKKMSFFQKIIKKDENDTINEDSSKEDKINDFVKEEQSNEINESESENLKDTNDTNDFENTKQKNKFTDLIKKIPFKIKK